MMHLTTDEILNFVTMESITPEGISFAAKVNCHIMQCDECRKKLEAFQAVNDGLSGTRLSDPQRNVNDIFKFEPDKNDPDKGLEIK